MTYTREPTSPSRLPTLSLLSTEATMGGTFAIELVSELMTLLD